MAKDLTQQIMVTLSEIQSLANRIAALFRPEKIILFGSYAYGTPTPDSDVDLLVILPFEGKNFHQSLKIINAVNPPFGADVLARRPDDTRWRYEQGDPLVREALDRGKVLYEKTR